MKMACGNAYVNNGPNRITSKRLNLPFKKLLQAYFHESFKDLTILFVRNSLILGFLVTMHIYEGTDSCLFWILDQKTWIRPVTPFPAWECCYPATGLNGRCQSDCTATDQFRLKPYTTADRTVRQSVWRVAAGWWFYLFRVFLHMSGWQLIDTVITEIRQITMLLTVSSDKLPCCTL